ncbi:hypothetical protein HUG17_0556 [Dermatophagoides farinae]|uniref:Uncharacterized protein n=1 Tax=Dermatophagoides farinae TaxID=6954 RepID=A0A9D4P6K2_DERFA|nr:hypothetical protein HUG17_0556 [Dermatophagoides farinae]
MSIEHLGKVILVLKHNIILKLQNVLQNWFHQRSIPNKTELLTPLYELSKKDSGLQLTACRTAFNKVIEVLSSDLVLHL